MVTPSNVVMLSCEHSLKLLNATLQDTCDITGTSLGTQKVKGARKRRDGLRSMCSYNNLRTWEYFILKCEYICAVKYLHLVLSNCPKLIKKG